MDIESAEWQRVAIVPQRNTVTIEAHAFQTTDHSTADKQIQSVRVSNSSVISDPVSKRLMKPDIVTSCEASFHHSGDRIAVSLRPTSVVFIEDQEKRLHAFLALEPIPPGTHYVDADDFQRGKPHWIPSEDFKYDAEFCTSFQRRPAIICDRWIAVASGPVLSEKPKVYFPEWDTPVSLDLQPTGAKGKAVKKKIRNKGLIRHEFPSWPLRMSLYQGYFQNITLHSGKIANGFLQSWMVDGNHVKAEGVYQEPYFREQYKRTVVSKQLARETRDLISSFGQFERNRDTISAKPKKLVVA